MGDGALRARVSVADLHRNGFGRNLTTGEIVSQLCSLIYFAFCLLMPWYSKIDKCKPEPERVIFK